MTPKEYLRQVERMDRRLQLDREKLERLRAAVEYRSPGFEGTGGSGGKGTALDRLLELEQECDRKAAEYIDKYKEIETAISQIGNETLEEVLELRYLQFMKWPEIAQRLHYTERHVTRLHGQALRRIRCP